MKPAYDAYDAALKAAVKEDYDTARTELAKAMEIEPRESIFHALEGDLFAEADRNSAALRSFDMAVQLDDSFFYHPLRRGQIRYDMGQHRAARTDLERSLEMLPTAPAHYLLGNMDRDSGELDSARWHYEQASQSDSELGQKAQRELVLMDIATSPGKFVDTLEAADKQGRIYCLIKNRSRLGLTAISVLATFIGEDGRSSQASKTYSPVLEGGKQDSIRFD